MIQRSLKELFESVDVTTTIVNFTSVTRSDFLYCLPGFTVMLSINALYAVIASRFKMNNTVYLWVKGLQEYVRTNLSSTSTPHFVML